MLCPWRRARCDRTELWAPYGAVGVPVSCSWARQPLRVPSNSKRLCDSVWFGSLF